MVPQLAAPASVHWAGVAATGGWPTGMFVQVPRLVPDSAHDWHVPVQAVAQQTPWAQNPELHSAALAHVLPSTFFEQVVPLHTFGDVQSLSMLQTVLQMFMLASQA